MKFLSRRSSMISFEDFKKLDLRIAKIIKAEKVESSEKLVKLRIDLGNDDPSTSRSTLRISDPMGSGQGERQIVAGIGKAYSAEDLVGKQIVVVANLEPRFLMGLESQGMLLATSGENGPILLIPDKEVESGSAVS